MSVYQCENQLSHFQLEIGIFALEPPECIFIKKLQNKNSNGNSNGKRKEENELNLHQTFRIRGKGITFTFPFTVSLMRGN